MGQWIINLKHGYGFKSYANRDWYDGAWRMDLQDGIGRYEWNDETNYIGEWRNGTISGKGTFVWANGNVFEGFWKDGLPKGNGTFKWPDESYYEGNWSKDNKEHNGTYYPSKPLEDRQCEWDPKELYNYLSEYSVYPAEKVLVLPSQNRLIVWKSTKVMDNGNKPRRISVDGKVSVSLDSYTYTLLSLRPKIHRPHENMIYMASTIPIH
ncbi:hypothetical protein RJT34_20060 [Clitoria ternatea]|uniref:MORN repeat-containing protein 3 n=1 Tax=Clitoria ternatea TaxID=43366 RepID=A0AAN9ISN2_CLITE